MAAAASASSSSALDFDSFTPDELLVSQILLELPFLCHNSSPSQFSLGSFPTWSFRRKRSALDSTPPSSKILKESSPTTPFSLTSSKSRSESEENNAPAIAIANANANAKSSKKKPPSLTLNKVKKSQCLEAIDELTKEKRVLEENVEAMKQHYTHLKTINSQLKLKKQEMILDSKNKSKAPGFGTATKLKFTVKSPTLDHPPPSQNQFQPLVTAAPTTEPHKNGQNHIQPLVTAASTSEPPKNSQNQFPPLVTAVPTAEPSNNSQNQFPPRMTAAPTAESSNNSQNQFPPRMTAAPTAESNQNNQNFQFQFAGVPFYDPSSMGPMGIPDLNISLEEISQRNYSRFMAARARQNRIQICKTKNNGAAKLHS